VTNPYVRSDGASRLECPVETPNPSRDKPCLERRLVYSRLTPFNHRSRKESLTVITDLAHTALRVHDLERSLAFYRLLGLHEAFRLHHTDGSLMLVYLHVGGDRFLELFPGGMPDGGRKEQSFMHLCLASDDLKADVEALRAQGVTIELEPSVGLDHNLQAWIRDPDGNDIELMQLSEDSPQRRIARGESLRP
jgi:lactoylglutathione lyase